MTFNPNADDLVERNRAYAVDFHDQALEVRPTRQLAVVTCMDSRIDTFKVLGLHNGEAHIIRNAGGVVTDDVIRSLCLSQRYLGTREILLVHHTNCGLQNIDESAFRSDLEAETGVKPWWSLEGFSDPYDDVRQSIHRITMTPFISYKDQVRGFVYDVSDGLLKEVDPEGAWGSGPV